MKKGLIILCVPGLIVLGLFGAAWHFSSKLLYPEPGKCDKKHFVYCGSASQLGIPFEDISFKTRDGLTLRGWYFPEKNSNKAIIMVHGITADRHEMLRWVKSLHGSGFNLLLYDQRNHGKSDKSVSGMGMREKDDISAAVDYLAGSRGIDSIGLFGVSMGAATGIPAMAGDGRISAGVFEASYADLRDLLVEIARRDLHLPAFPLLDVTALLFRLRGGIDMSAVRPEAHIGRIAPRPVLIIHCSGDRYVPPSHGERIFTAAREPKEIWRAGCKNMQRHGRGIPREPRDAYRNSIKKTCGRAYRTPSAQMAGHDERPGARTQKISSSKIHQRPRRRRSTVRPAGPVAGTGRVDPGGPQEKGIQYGRRSPAAGAGQAHGSH